MPKLILLEKDHLHRLNEIASLDPVEIETAADRGSGDALTIPGDPERARKTSGLEAQGQYRLAGECLTPRTRGTLWKAR